jgi:hypothetical protein
MGGLYIRFDSNGEIGSLKVPRGIAVESQAGGIAKYPRLLVHRHEAGMTPAKHRRHPQNSAILVALLAVA